MGTKTEAQAAALIERIKSDIIFGRLRPREHLVEEEIGAKFVVSRHVVRAAFGVLEQMGLITRRPNRGAIVRDFSVEQVEQLYDLRAVLQAEAARRVPMPAPSSFLAELGAIHARYCAAHDAGDLRAVNDLNDTFHRRIWDTCNNRYLAEAIDRLWIETTGIRWYGVGDPVQLIRSRREHEMMIEQLRTGDRGSFVDLSVTHMLPPLEAYKRAHAGYPAELIV